MRIAAIGCLMIAIALLSMRTLGPSRARDHSFSFTKDFHVGVGAGGGWPGVWIYNDGAYGPYRGSIISVSDDDSIETREFGMTAGIYYRWFHRDGMTLWTLHIDLWWLVILFAGLPAAYALVAFGRKAKRSQMRCPA